jgi:predicted Rossmann fold flavoprotein
LAAGVGNFAVSIPRNEFDLIIIGAGAAGMMAAIAAAHIRVGGRRAGVLLLDGREKIGAKILVSGGGRCNVTNEFVHPSRFHTESDPNRRMAFKGDGARSFVGRVLRAFSQQHTLQFFETLGVELKLEDTGKYFPVSDSAREVLNALISAVEDSGATLKTGVRVEQIAKTETGFRLRTSMGVLPARAVVVCSGGLALPKSGSDGSGLEWAKKFGHRIVATTPALTPLISHRSPHAHLAGVAVPVRLDFQSGDDRVAYNGPLLFTHIGYSGPVALNISRHIARGNGVVKMRILPEVKGGEEGVFWQEFVKRNSKKTLGSGLQEFLPRRVCETLEAQVVGGASSLAIGKFSSAQQKRAREILFAQELKIDEVAPYVKAETTAGGVALDEIEPATMMSKIEDGLFFAGEVCDVDGWLGGYNFQWAWSSGTVAGRAAARFVLK